MHLHGVGPEPHAAIMGPVGYPPRQSVPSIRRPEVTMLPPKHTIPATNQRTKPQTRLDINRIRSAIPRMAPVFQNTPQYTCPPLGEVLDCEPIVKLETANPVRCFKARGTETVMARLTDNPGPKSAVCASVGNLGLALDYSGQSRGISVSVVVASSSSPIKIDRTQYLSVTAQS